jgi:hypothetical protein
MGWVGQVKEVDWQYFKNTSVEYIHLYVPEEIDNENPLNYQTPAGWTKRIFLTFCYGENAKTHTQQPTNKNLLSLLGKCASKVELS